MTDWQPIDTAPKDGTEIILASWQVTAFRNKLICWWLEESHWQTSDDGEGECWCLTEERHRAHRDDFPATHWMPLPPPKQERNR